MDKLKVVDVMRRRVLTAKADVSTHDALVRMARRRVGSIVVTENGSPIGIFTEHDLIDKYLHYGEILSSTPLGEVMTQSLVTLSPDSELENAYQKMQKGNFRHLLVTDGNRLAGIVSIKDLIRTRQKMLERKVEEKTDELNNTKDRLAESLHILHRDMTVAGNFQKQLIEEKFPEFKGVQFTHTYEQAQSLGGDFIEVFRLGPSRAGIFVGDVMGHGIASAFIVMALKQALDNLVPKKLGPSRTIQKLNRSMLKNNQLVDGYFVAGCFMDIDIERQIGSYTQFGLPMPGVFRAATGKYEEMPPTDTPLGIRNNSEYPERSISFAPGDVLMLFTDGCCEQRTKNGKPLGEAKFASEFVRLASRGDEDISKKLFDRVRRHAGGMDIVDDIAILTMRWL